MEEVPEYAVSMTVSQILKCRHIISAVPYEVKADAIYRTVTSEVTDCIPATALKLHPNAVVFVDQQSGEKIREIARGESEIDFV